MTKLISILALLALTGCSTVVPKKVEFFQDKVEPFPEHTEYARELQKQLVQRMEQKSNEVVVAAVKEQASTNVVAPAKEVQRLAIAESVLVGPPVKPAPPSVPSVKLAEKVEKEVAKLDQRIEEFKVENNVNVGKKIEGTGIFQVSYFLWIGGIVAAIAVIYAVARIALSIAAMTNPGAAIGLNAVKVASSVVQKGFSQLIKGGETFKDWVGKEVQDANLKEKILDAFRTAHERTQDDDVQNTIRALTK